MRLFVLAAGKGTRLAPETHDRPKCLVHLQNGSSFVSHLLSLAEQIEYFDEAFIITGHHSNTVDEALKKKHVSLDTQTIYNPFFEVAGPIVSLWVGSEKMTDQNFMVCNGDTYYTHHPFKKVWTHKREAIRLCVDNVSRPRDDDMKIRLDSQGNLTYVGKDLPLDQTNAVSTGLLMVKGPRMRRLFTQAVNELIHVSENVQTWKAWHIVLNHLAEKGVPVETVNVHPHDWAEVDTPDELHQLRVKINGHASTWKVPA